MSAAANVFDFNTAARRDNLPAPQDNDRRLDDLRSTLRSRAKDVVRDVFPHARIIGHTARIGDLGGAPGESLAIEISGDKAGLWMDHATAESGDLIDLWTATQGYKGEGGFWQAVEDLELHLGLASGLAWNGPVAKIAETRKRQPAPAPVSKALEATYVYTDAGGQLFGKVFRYRLSNGKKTFMQQNAAGEWKAPAEPRPLYNQPAIALANTVVLVEGEKCVDRLSALGLEATTVLGGSNVELHRTDWSPIAGKRVILWADNDGEGKTEATSFVGKKYMERVEVHLRGLGCQVVSVAIPPGKPAKWDVADAGDEEALTLLKAALTQLDAAPPRRNRLLRLSDMRKRPAPLWLVQGMIQERSYSVVVGDSGAMKSFVAIGWALSIAYGRGEWLGKAVKSGAVVYVAGEGQSGILNRLEAHVERWGLEEKGDGDLYLYDEAVDMPGGDVDVLLTAIREEVNGAPIQLIVLDTLAQCFGSGDENAQSDMNAFNNTVKRLQAETGAAVLAIHHLNRMGGARGSTNLRAALDTMMLMEREGPNLVLRNHGEPTTTKQKDAAPFDDLHLTYDVVPLGCDEDGNPMSSVVLVKGEEPPEMDPDAAPRERKGRSFGPKPKPLRDATVDFFNQAPGRDFSIPTLQASLPGSRSGIWKVLRALVGDGVLTMTGDPDRLLYRLSDGDP